MNGAGGFFRLFPERFEASNAEHREIIKGLENKDSKQVAALVYKQKSEGFMKVIQFLKSLEFEKE